jgi:hypothetical protein
MQRRNKGGNGMTNKEAVQFLEEHQYFPCPEYRMTQATNMAINALREVEAMEQELKERRVVMPVLAKHERELLAELEKREWVRTSERVPTYSDASNPSGEILAFSRIKEYWCLHPDLVAEYPKEYPYWMPLPPMPEVEA